ncbi:MAG: penicillin-binding protein 2, partial [Alphaproteobacteria bacterium]|nr:penicillin-binding protein 2 [Alphaproteobacteria bacterium]
VVGVSRARGRLAVVAGVFCLCFLALALRLVELAWPRDSGTGIASGDQAGPGAGRADVVDRNGVLLATSLRTASVFANPPLVLDPEEAARGLVAVLPDLDEAEVVRKLRSGRTFVWLKRNLTPLQKAAILRLGLPGVGFQDEYRRIYPQGVLTAHVVGFAGVDDHGLAGVEKALDAELTERERVPGTPVALTLDVRIQHILRGALEAAVARFRAVGAAGLVLDVATGEVLALVSLPDFDPNHPAGAADDARFNRVTLGIYEMGSTFKTFTTAMALEAGTVDLQGGYDASSPIRVARYVIHDDHPKSRWLSVPEIFIYSSNIGAAKMALQVGGQRQKEFLTHIGMLSQPSIELAEVGTPLWPRTWRDINTMTVAFGHGIAVSPLQLASGVAALVNGGILVSPTLRKGSAGRAATAPRVISEATSAVMRKLLRLVVLDGTGRLGAAAGYLVGGKTGTAEKVSGRRYNRKALLSSFVAAFPMDAPRYVVLVMIDEPKGTKETHGFASGGWTAAPVVGSVVARIGPLLGIAPVDEGASAVRREMMIEGFPPVEATLASF